MDILFIVLPSLAILLGGAYAFLHVPGKKLESAVQHLAAGIVLAVVAVELTPDLMRDVHRWAVAIGFILGVLLMFFIEWMSGVLKKRSKDATLPLELLSAVSIDIFIDGLLIGIALIVGMYEGGLIAVGLAIEIFFLGLAVSHALRLRSTLSRWLNIVVLAMIPLFGALIGRYVFSDLPVVWLDGVLSLGIAALLYLALEELLLEAHENYNGYGVNLLFFLVHVTFRRIIY